MDSTEHAVKALQDSLKLPTQEKFQTKGKRRVCYFSDLGLSIDASAYVIKIQFHSTFFAIYGFNRFIKVKTLILKGFGEPSYIKAIHVAQDFEKDKNILPTTTEHIYFKFKVGGFSYKNENTGEPESIYYNGPKRRWQLNSYDKSQELKVNKSKNKRKFEIYQKRGYLERPIQRVELRLNAEMCNSIPGILAESDENALCKKILKRFYFGHRSYLSHSNFDKHNANREKEWPLWKKLFNITEEKASNPPPPEFTAKLFENKSIQELFTQFTRTVARYNPNALDLIEYMFENRDEVAKEIEDFRRNRAISDLFLMSLDSQNLENRLVPVSDSERLDEGCESEPESKPARGTK